MLLRNAAAVAAAAATAAAAAAAAAGQVWLLLCGTAAALAASLGTRVARSCVAIVSCWLLPRSRCPVDVWQVPRASAKAREDDCGSRVGSPEVQRQATHAAVAVCKGAGAERFIAARPLPPPVGQVVAVSPTPSFA
jgi:hypothetical protein